MISNQLPELDTVTCPWCEKSLNTAGYAIVIVDGWRVPMHHDCQAVWEQSGRPNTTPVPYKDPTTGKLLARALVRGEYLKTEGR